MSDRDGPPGSEGLEPHDPDPPTDTFALPHVGQVAIPSTDTAGGGRQMSQTQRFFDDNVPSGVFCGPRDAPDDYELLADVPAFGNAGFLYPALFRGPQAGLPGLAIKVLKPYGRDPYPGWPTTQQIQTWNEQVKLGRMFDSKHLARCYEYFEGERPHHRGSVPPGSITTPYHYVTMEWVDGLTLADTLRTNHNAPMHERLSWILGTAEALETMHYSLRRTGVGQQQVSEWATHGDVKPANIILNPTRGAVLTDLQTLVRHGVGAPPQGAMTPNYTSPEVLAKPHAYGIEHDVYALGCVAYEVLSGERPDRKNPDRMRATLLQAATRRGAGDPQAVVRLIVDDVLTAPVPPNHALAWARQLEQAAAARPDLGTGSGTTAGRLARVLAPLVAIAVLLAAGSAYALTRAGGGDDGAGGDPSASPSAQVLTANYIGQEASLVEDQLTAQGITVTMTPTPAPLQRPGIVVAQDPPAGAPLPSAMTLVVTSPEASPSPEPSRTDSASPVISASPDATDTQTDAPAGRQHRVPPNSTYLTALSQGQDDPMRGIATLGGVDYVNSLRYRLAPGPTYTTDFTLRAAQSRFTTVVGWEDRDPAATSPVELQVLVDGVRILAITYDPIDGPSEITCRIPGSKELTLIMNKQEGYADNFVWGDATVDPGEASTGSTPCTIKPLSAP